MVTTHNLSVVMLEGLGRIGLQDEHGHVVAEMKPDTGCNLYPLQAMCDMAEAFAAAYDPHWQAMKDDAARREREAVQADLERAAGGKL